MTVKSTPTKRISKRRYPPKKCKKPECDKEFVPEDKRQKFCCPQHRVDYNNDQRKIKNALVDNISAILKKNDAILHKFSVALKENKQEKVSVDFLRFEGFNFNVNSTSDNNANTGMRVYWQISYGIEGADKEAKTFIIHKK